MEGEQVETNSRIIKDIIKWAREGRKERLELARSGLASLGPGQDKFEEITPISIYLGLTENNREI